MYSFKIANVKTEPLLIRPLVTVSTFISLVHTNCIFCNLYRIFVCKANPKVRLCYYFIKKTNLRSLKAYMFTVCTQNQKYPPKTESPGMESVHSRFTSQQIFLLLEIIVPYRKCLIIFRPIISVHIVFVLKPRFPPSTTWDWSFIRSTPNNLFASFKPEAKVDILFGR